jgi:hypothetical protein
MKAVQDFKPLILKDENGGRSRDRTVDLLLVSSTFMAYIADSYGGRSSFLRPLRVSPALIAQLSEQLFGIDTQRARVRRVKPRSRAGLPKRDIIGLRR